MPKLPWMKWVARDWLSDPQLSQCKPATRGIWADAISAMHEMDRCGQLSGTLENLARVCRCRVDEMRAAVDDLRATGAGDVTECNNFVTLINRRQHREWAERQAVKNRVDKWRKRKPETEPKRNRNGPVTLEMSEDRYKNKEIKETSGKKRRSFSPPDSKKPKEDPRAAPLKLFIESEYQRIRGVKLITESSDWIQFAAMLKATNGHLNIEQLQFAWTSFLDSPDLFHRKQGHPLRWWATNINAFLASKSLPLRSYECDGCIYEFQMGCEHCKYCEKGSAYEPRK